MSELITPCDKCGIREADWNVNGMWLCDECEKELEE